MADLIDLEIITANRVVVRTPAREVYVPAAFGRAGILHHHLPYTALLGMGEVRYTDAGGRRHYLFLQRGLVETADNKVVILADRITKADELDSAALKEEMQRVRAAIAGAAKGETTPGELEKALERERELTVMLEIAAAASGRSD